MRFFFLLFGIVLWLESRPQTFNSTASGSWETGANWDQGSVPSSTLGTQTVTVGSGHAITRNGDINFTSSGTGDLNVNGSSSQLNVTGDVIFEGNSGSNHTITVAATGLVTIDGSVIYQQNSNPNPALDISGTVIIGVNMEMQSNAGSNIGITIRNGGVLIVQGDWTMANGALNNLSIENGGTLIVGGNFNQGNGSNFTNNGTIYSGSTSGTNPNISGTGPEGDMDDLLNDSPDLCNMTDVCASLLPVELIEIKTHVSGNEIVLTWITSTELHNDYFTIERSTESGTFYEEVGRVAGSGTSNLINVYSWRDQADLTDHLTYYRLSQTDYDGTLTCLGVLPVYSGNTRTRVEVYPNPFPAGESLQIDGPDLSGREWMMTATDGKIYENGIIGPGNKVRIHNRTHGIHLLRIIHSELEIPPIKILVE